MKDLILINPRCQEESKTERLKKIIKYSVDGCQVTELSSLEEIENFDLRNRRILFTISLGKSGINLSWYSVLKYLRLNQTALTGSVGGVILDSDCEFYTKSVGRNLVFAANRAGCTFPGRPLVEGTRTLKNYKIQAQNLKTDNMGAYMSAGRTLVENILSYQPVRKANPRLLVLHSNNERTSNSTALWNLIRKELPDAFTVVEKSLRNGEVVDCRGCSFETCSHFGMVDKCFYGGPIVEEIYPELLSCDGLVMLCPNYNDALSANLTAFINRMTALFTAHRFYEKQLFGVIVSGYSGSDIIAEQLISGLNMNKTFALPPRFATMHTANNPGEILMEDSIIDEARIFAENIRKSMLLEG